MKKGFRAVIAVLAGAMIFSGCSSEKEKSINTQIIEATSGLKSYTGTTEISFTATDNGTVSMGTTGTVNIQNEPFYADINLDIYTESDTIGNDKTQSRMILETKDGENTVYLYNNDEWHKEKVDSKNFRKAASQYDVTETAVLMMEAATNVQKFATEEYNGAEADKYEGRIAKSLLPDLLDETGLLALVGTNISSKFYDECDDMYITLWVNSDNVIVGYEIDLTPIVQSLFNILYRENGITDESEIIKFDSYIAKGTVSEYNNKINTEVPEEAKAAAEVNSDGTEVTDSSAS